MTAAAMLSTLCMMFGMLISMLSCGYSVLACAVNRPRRAVRSMTAARSSGVTVLKPLCGHELELYDQLRSFCLQGYPRLQIIFGVRDRADPAVAVAQRLQCEFPDLQLQLVICAASHGANRKVSNLINMMSLARHDYLVLSDSDVRVPPGYLETVLAPLRDPGCGLVTCAYRARPAPGLWSALGAMFIDEWFMPSVRVAAALGSQAFTSGATIALRRGVLERSGGLEALADQLADDFRLGERVRALGLRTVLSEVIVETTVDEPTLAAFVRHHLRWLRTVHSIQPFGYAGAFVTFSLPAGLIGAALTRGAPLALILLAVTAIARLMLHLARHPTHKSAALRSTWLIPIHDLLAFALWCWSFRQQQVTWRDARYVLERDGTLRAAAAPQSAPEDTRAPS